jgi:hypothetical protein
LDPDQVNGTTIGLTSAVAFSVLQPPNLGHHHDDVIGSVLSGAIRHSQPDIRCLESSAVPTTT